MKKEMKPGVAVAVIVVVLLGAVWYVFMRGSGSSGTTTPVRYGAPAGAVMPQGK